MATTATIVNCDRALMPKPGIDVTTYKPHSVKLASTSKAGEQEFKTAGGVVSQTLQNSTVKVSKFSHIRRIYVLNCVDRLWSITATI